jgi:TolA-binding protein
LDQDELLQAQDELSRLLALEPGLANYDEFVYYQALQALKAGNFAQVVQNLTDFESRFPASPLVPQAQFKLGTAYYQLGELSRAAECYRAAAQNEALRVDALSNLAIIYREENRFDEAIEVYKELLKIESLPQRDEFLFRLGYTQLQNHDHQAAALVFNEMLARPLAPERRCEVLHWLGETYLGMGEVSKALFQFLKIPYLYPEEELWAVTAELKAGTCYELMGKPEKARSIYEVVIKRRGETDEWAQEAQRRLKNLEP